MNLPTTRHEDNRRVLTEYVHDIPFRRAKVLEVKERSVLGKHYHLNNDSVFYVVKGKASYDLKSRRPNSKPEHGWLYDGDCIFVPRGIIHTFEVWPNTIMLECASEPFDPNDEIQATE